MQLGRLVAALALAGATLATSVAAHSQTAPVRDHVVAYVLDSGVLANRTTAEQQVYSAIIDAGDVPWVRIAFGHVQLAPGSRLQLASLLDGAAQTLTATTLAQWRYSSAYFNGARVRLSLIAAAGSDVNTVQVDHLLVGDDVAGTESQCGPTDDRVPSFEPARARLLNIGCTASIYNEQSCFITAGHCLSSPSLVNVVEFNVPPSLPNGNLVHPAPADQYVPTSERMFINGGIGNDWGLFKVFPNTQTGLLPFAAQGAMLTLATSVPALGTTLRIVGYGIDGGTANQTQQEHSGPLTAVSANALNYQVDTEGGNSGSAVTRASDDVIIGIHTHAGCNTGGGGANAGTAITHPGLQSALQSFCTATAGVGCADINRMVGRCNATSGRVQIIVRMTDTSHAGQSMVATVDGSPVNLPINFGGGRFGFAQGNFGGGVHTISLVDPANCTNVPDLQLSCP